MYNSFKNPYHFKAIHNALYKALDLLVYFTGC